MKRIRLRKSHGSPLPSGQRGVALLFYVLILGLFLLPVMVSFLNESSRFEKHTLLSRNLKEARMSAYDIVAEIMRQLSLDLRLDHYSPYVYDRKSSGGVNTFAGIGFQAKSRITGTIQATPNPDQKYVYLNVTGNSSVQSSYTYAHLDVTRILDSQRVHAVLAFVNDIFRFGSVVHRDLTVNVGHAMNNQTLSGGVWVDGAMNLSGGGMTLNGGPVIVRGNFIGSPTTTLASGTTIYYSGSFSPNGGNYLGNTINWVPELEILSPDAVYYRTRSNYYNTGDSTWTLRMAGSPAQCRCYYNGASYWTIPPDGGVLVNTEGNLWVSGSVNCRTTLVAGGSDTDPTKGVVYISTTTNFGAGPATTAQSVAVIAHNKIVFQRPGGGAMNVYGYYRAPDIEINDDAGVATNLNLVGTLDYTIDLTANGNSTLTVTRDANLSKYIPKRLPEKHTLASWRPQGN